MKPTAFLRDVALWGFYAFLLFLARLLVDAILLEPHYFWAIRSGLLKAPMLLFAIPLTLWADMAAAAVLVLGARHGSKGPLTPPLFAAGLCLILAHLGQGSPLKLPLIIPLAWVLCSGFAVWGVWSLARALRPEPSLRPLAELQS